MKHSSEQSKEITSGYLALIKKFKPMEELFTKEINSNLMALLK